MPVPSNPLMSASGCMPRSWAGNTQDNRIYVPTTQVREPEVAVRLAQEHGRACACVPISLDSVVEPTYTVKALDEAKWPDCAVLVEANNGVFGGCWCMGFRTEGADKEATPALNRQRKLSRVLTGSAHAALMYNGEACVGRDQGDRAPGPGIDPQSPYQRPPESRVDHIRLSARRAFSFWLSSRYRALSTGWSPPRERAPASVLSSCRTNSKISSYSKQLMDH
jgi:hypothetical protein